MRLILLVPLICTFAASAAEPPVFDVRAFGAREYNDREKFKCTQAIARAIDEATRAPGYDKTGCIIQVPKGKWLTGPIELKSNLTLRIEKDATLLFSADPEDDPPAQLTRWEGIECVNYGGFIRARDAQNIAISGKGTIDGNGRGWWPMYRAQESGRRKLREMAAAVTDPRERVFASPAQWPRDVFAALGRDESQSLRPSFIEFINCRNVRFEGFTVRNVPMYAIHPVYCQDVVCKDLYVVALGPDGDGIVADSCERVTIEKCTFDCYEDCVSIKSGRDGDGRRVNRPCRDVTVKACTFVRGASAVAIGSETSGGVRGVNVTECTMTGVARGLRIKTMRGRGGTIETVRFNKSKLADVGEAAVVIDMQFNPTPRASFNQETTPVLKDLAIRDIDAQGGTKPCLIRGLPESPIEGLTLASSKVRADRGLELRHVRSAEITETEVWAKDGWTLYGNDIGEESEPILIDRLKPLKAPEEGPVISLKDARSVTIRSVPAPEETDVFLKVTGKRSKDITLDKCDTEFARQRVESENDVAEGAVKDEP